MALVKRLKNVDDNTYPASSAFYNKAVRIVVLKC
jgi:predicted nuclease of restriction endonuclease-like (RecB) superfamily